MRKIITILSCLLWSLAGIAQEGIQFQNITLSEALAKAKAENKLVFMDCYTAWCGPCKFMANTLFTQKEAGDFFNPRFVCVKYDMEKGEGKRLNDNWHLAMYPQFIIFRPDSVVQHRILGASDDLPSFIQRVERGLNKKTALCYMHEMYAKGGMSKKQLLDYKVTLFEGGAPEEIQMKVREELMSRLTEKDKLKKYFWPWFDDLFCLVGTEDFNLIRANISTFEKNIGREKLIVFMLDRYKRVLKNHIIEEKKWPSYQPYVSLEELKKQIDELPFREKQELVALVEMARFEKEDKPAELMTVIEQNIPVWNSDNFNLLLESFVHVKNVTKAEMARMATALEKVQAGPQGKEIRYLDFFIDKWKAESHVGTRFEDLNLKMALAKAKRMQKMLFIDGYTAWCGPCKRMAENVFPQEVVGDYMNPKFICVKYDLERGEGLELAKKYKIQAYPTFLIMDGDGNLLHTLVGGDNAERFIERMEKEVSQD